MRVIIVESPDDAAQIACQRIADCVRIRQKCVLGLATGSTPVAAYRLLIEEHRMGNLDFAGVTSFNLDEYVGLGASHPQSYRTFMQEKLFDHVNISPERTHVPDGAAVDLLLECTHYEQAIRQAGGIDLQLLGIGRDGHIAFNEPGSSLASRTRLMMLARQTILDNARFFGTEDLVPKAALTMGIGTILDSRQILVLATGEGKAEAVRAMIEGPISSMVPASALQWHPDVVVVLDAAAAHRLEQRDYYLEFEQLRNKLGV